LPHDIPVTEPFAAGGATAELYFDSCQGWLRD
jgi:hypothetical protein